jgi:hypothetical protein
MNPQSLSNLPPGSPFWLHVLVLGPTSDAGRMHGSSILLVLGLAPLALTIFWLIRIRLGLPGRETASAPQGALALQAEGN